MRRLIFGLVAMVVVCGLTIAWTARKQEISATKICQNHYLQPCVCVCYLGVVALKTPCGRDER